MLPRFLRVLPRFRLKFARYQSPSACLALAGYFGSAVSSSSVPTVSSLSVPAFPMGIEDPTGARMHEDAARGGDPEPGGRPAVAYLAWQAWTEDASGTPEGVEPLSFEEAGGELWEPEDEIELPVELPMPGLMDYGSVDADVQVPTTLELGQDKARARTNIGADINTLNYPRPGP
ncbi:hypothetical protein KFL_010900040 [Klebsormidium nitens]|uniref:Uncharacterized protein n=1 Tax=Klebsormidium nitens TaxID=105231 RepID=A0A1Y1IPK3_KLENI|nr:hypothetical protein KFL_010900040 [Klebsormidium nitens]|eukprot:GAQ92674.1 hypothetical protein KFL_010900040 [Klebsormidium nitens]